MPISKDEWFSNIHKYMEINEYTSYDELLKKIGQYNADIIGKIGFVSRAHNPTFVRSHVFIDYNMVDLYDEDKADGTENMENVENFNLFNVVACNANIDRMRKDWPDMPDMNDRVDYESEWLDNLEKLHDMINHGAEQKKIIKIFPIVFGEDCIMPGDVIGQPDMLDKYNTSYMTYRRFELINGYNRVVETYDEDFIPLLETTVYKPNNH